MRTAKLGASDLGLTLQAEVGLVSGHAEHPLNARLGPVYSSQADLGFLLSWVYEYPPKNPTNGCLQASWRANIWLLWVEVREVSLGALELRGSPGTDKERYFLGRGQGKARPNFEELMWVRQGKLTEQLLSDIFFKFAILRQ